MKILAANCRGLARASANRDIRALLRQHSPDCLVLSETLITESSMISKLNSWGFNHYCYVPPINLSGGFCAAWKSSLRVEPVEMDKHVIHCLVYLEPSPTPWTLSALYGPSRVSDRPAFWNKIGALKERFNNPWLLVGDLNGTLLNNERAGPGVSRFAHRSSQPLRQMVENVGLIDLGVAGGKYTWRNGRRGMAFARARLDRALCDDQWRRLYPSTRVTMLPATFSDHSPLIIDLLHGPVIGGLISW
ncbi:Endonuclease/exonuclease/phosphatase [Trema orientale]|uniref:Endonuclease/exonuclease/phosphatase n=1 Tax=Trema orientale TaxID=63057 RepID=A0A2P5FH99_TREOI|nr:Endonuclease/exonuclease/phosphatase [Trema orientale]